MAASPKAAKEKARKAQAHARQAEAQYRTIKAKAKRERRSAAQRDARRRAVRDQEKSPKRAGFRAFIGVVAYLLVGVFPYLASYFILPPGALMVLMGLWVFGLIWTLRLARNSPTRTPLAPFIAVVTWAVLVQVGGSVFGWFE